MKPEDYIDENYVPTEEDFLPEKVDKKAQLRKDIRKQSGFNALAFIFLAVMLLKDLFVRDNSIYMLTSIVTVVLSCLFLVIAYFHIWRAHSVQEMISWHRRINDSSLLFKCLFVIIAVIAVVGAFISMKGEYPWYLTAFVIITLVAIIAVLLWLFANHKQDSLGEDIQRLKELEDEEKLNEGVKE